jgi:Sec7-like guanine-nucleotide exchange factor
MHSYVDNMDFSSLEFDTAIRQFLQVGLPKLGFGPGCD